MREWEWLTQQSREQWKWVTSKIGSQALTPGSKVHGMQRHQ